MEKIKKILVPIDGSDAAKRGLEMALSMATSTGAKVTVLEVIEEFGPLPGYYEAPPVGVDRVDFIKEKRFEKIHGILDKTKVPWERLVEEGFPADVICDVARSHGMDLIIIGSRGLSFTGRFLLGSVSDRVVHHAPCSVLVVRNRES